MAVKRKQHSANFKFRVALESLKGQKTIAQIAQEYGVHPSRIHHPNSLLFFPFRGLDNGDHFTFARGFANNLGHALGQVNVRGEHIPFHGARPWLRAYAIQATPLLACMKWVLAVRKVALA